MVGPSPAPTAGGPFSWLSETAAPGAVVFVGQINGHRIPANTGISVCSLLVHQHRDYWSDPERFDPERFSPERAEDKRQSHSYIPFGGGAHACIGMHFAGIQVKAFLKQFLSRYRVRLKPGHKVKMVPIPIPNPKDGLPVIMERID